MGGHQHQLAHKFTQVTVHIHQSINHLFIIYLYTFNRKKTLHNVTKKREIE